MKNIQNNKKSYNSYTLYRTVQLFFKKVWSKRGMRSKKQDTGLRGSENGGLYIDREVFYNRPEVQEAINNLMEHYLIQKRIKRNETKRNAL